MMICAAKGLALTYMTCRFCGEPKGNPCPMRIPGLTIGPKLVVAPPLQNSENKPVVHDWGNE